MKTSTACASPSRNTWRAVGGHPYLDKDYLHKASPVNFVERIQAPLLMACGKYDPRVRLKHGEVLEAPLKKYGKSFQNIVIGNEGHGFNKYENRLGFYGAMGRFLEEHLPIRKGQVTLGPQEVIEMPAGDKKRPRCSDFLIGCVKAS